MATNGIFILNSLIIGGIIVSALMAVSFDDLLASVIALGATGVLVALAFLILQAPDVALAEAAVGAVLSTTIFVIALRRIGMWRKEGEQK
ncbi:MAG: DUF4040 domain-containing protein [Clostridiales bacterium]|nr:DUF4040 domain-containing protein [Clostridiales bacterium]